MLDRPGKIMIFNRHEKCSVFRGFEARKDNREEKVLKISKKCLQKE